MVLCMELYFPPALGVPTVCLNFISLLIALRLMGQGLKRVIFERLYRSHLYHLDHFFQVSIPRSRSKIHLGF